MRDSSRTPLVSALAGVLLLGGLVAFAVGVPELADDAEAGGSLSGEGSGGASVELPDQLSDTFVAVDLGTLPAELAQQFGEVEALQEQQTSIAEGLERVFGVPGDFRVYAAEDGSALAQVTVLDRAPGLFTPDALPISPDVLGVVRASSELVEVDGAVCSVNWGQEVPAGQEVDPAQAPQAVRCQYGEGERTYEITAQGIAIDDGVAVLKDLASA